MSSRLPFWYRSTGAFTLGAVALSVSACLKAGDHNTSASHPSFLAISGHVIDPSGQPARDVGVFIDDESEQSAQSDSEGAFEVLLDAEALTSTLIGFESTETFRLFFASKSDARLVGISAPIAVDARGVVIVDPVTLANGATISGQVLQLANLDDVRPKEASGARVQWGRWVTTTKRDGAFVLEGVTPGTLELSVSGSALRPSLKSLTLAAGETRTLEQPLILFPDAPLAGIVVPVDSVPSPDQPLTRTFQVYAGQDVQLMRWSDDQSQFADPKGGAPWLPVPARFNYEFTKDGGQYLYYQFANADQSAVSAPYALLVTIDVFKDCKGFVVEDGGGYVTRPEVALQIDVPPVAFRMRIAESPEGLITAPWLVPQPAYIHAFRNVLPTDRHRVLYLQFADILGTLSPVYQATFELDLFPQASAPVFLINGGQPETTERLVRLDINVPPNAREMRVFEILPASSNNSMAALLGGGGGGGASGRDTSNLWMEPTPVFFFMFTNPGLKTVYLQFRYAGDIVSPNYQQVVRVDPFPIYGTGFVINDGAPSSPSRYLQIKLIPPPGAIAFKVFEMGAGGGSNQFNATGGGSVGSGPTTSYVTLMPTFSWTTPEAGLRTIFVQYKSLDGDESQAFAQSIYVEPFPPESGAFTINGGAPVTTIPELLLTIAPPPTAKEMAICEEMSMMDQDTMWLEVSNHATVVVRDTGPKTVYVRFRSIDNIVSGHLQQTIFYDPFPFGAAGVTIDGGAATTSDTVATLTLFAPPHLTQMRIGLEPLALLTLPLLEFRTTMTITLPDGPGMDKVYVQFANDLGETSPVYFDEIEFVPPPPPPPTPTPSPTPTP